MAAGFVGSQEFEINGTIYSIADETKAAELAMMKELADSIRQVARILK